MSVLEYSEDFIRQKRIYKNVHKCNVCPYFSKLIFFMINHVRRHHSTLESFDCEKPPEIYYCKDCDFRTHFLIFLKKHIRLAHLSNETESLLIEFSSQSYICKTCTFETHSALVWLKHSKRKCFPKEETQDEDTKALTALNEDEEPPVQKEDKEEVQKEDEEVQKEDKEEEEEGLPAFHKDEESIVCNICLFRTIKIHNFNAHARKRHNNLQWFECGKCVKRKYPKRQKAGPVWLNCEKCLLKTKIKWFKCDKCPFKAKNEIYLNLHLQRDHPKTSQKQ